MASAAELDAEQLYVANLNTVEFDLDFPTRGANGSNISWSSDSERFVRPTARSRSRGTAWARAMCALRPRFPVRRAR